MSEFQSDIRVSADVTGNRSTYRSVAVSSSAETALTIDTENFTADVTRKRKHNFHIGLSNEGLPLFTTEEVSICYIYLLVDI